MSMQQNPKSNISQTAVHMIGPVGASPQVSPRNATGVYVGTSDPLTAGRMRTNIPRIARGRLAPPHFFRPPHTSIERKRQQLIELLRTRDSSRGFHGSTHRRPNLDRNGGAGRSEEGGHEAPSPRRSDAIHSLDLHNFRQLTRQNPRRFTKANNSGVKHFELLRKPRAPARAQEEEMAEAMLVNELSRSRFAMLGIATCFDQLNVKSEENVKTLLPRRRTRSSPPHRQDARIPQMGTAKLMASLPHASEVKSVQGLPARSPGPTFYRHFGMEERVESWHNHQIAKRIESNVAASTSSNNDPTASQLSSSELHRTGFLNRGSSDQPISDIDVDRIFAKPESEQKKVLRENIDVPCPTAANTRPTTRDELDGRSPPAPLASSSAALARGNSEIESAEDEERDKVSEMSSPMPPRIKMHAPPRRIQSMSQIDISVHNEEGEADTVEIDIADEEEAKEEQKYVPYARRQSISDRISRRRHSELAAEIIRLSAENRRREFAELLNEHKQLVAEIEGKADDSPPVDDLAESEPDEEDDEEENKENEQT